MVYSRIDSGSGDGYIVLRPNNSATWRFNMMVLASLAFIAFCISTFFMLQGLWMIMPFAGLELIALFVCLYLRTRENIRTEVIHFNADKVVIEQGRTFAEKTWEYSRAWSKIFVNRPQRDDQPSRVVIRSHGNELELGSFLNKDDKDVLIARLRKLISNHGSLYQPAAL